MRLYWAALSIPLGFLVGGAVAQTLINWSAGYTATNILGWPVYIVILVMTLLSTVGGLISRSTRPSRRESFFLSIMILIFAAVSAFGFILTFSFVAGMIMG
jgi:hypothetical protein